MASTLIQQIVAENFDTTKSNDGSTVANLTEVWTVDSTANPFEIEITSANEALFVGNGGKTIPCVLNIGKDFHFVTARNTAGLTTTVVLESPLDVSLLPFTDAELTNRHEGLTGQHLSHTGYRAYADRMLDVGSEFSAVRSFYQPSGTAAAEWTRFGAATTALADVTVNPFNALNGIWFAHQQLSTRLQVSNSTDVQGMRQTIPTTLGNHRLIFEAGMSGSTVDAGNLCVAKVFGGPTNETLLFEENFYEEVKRFEVDFFGESDIKIEISKIDTASTTLRSIHVGDLAIYDDVVENFTIESGDIVCLIGDSWFASNQPTFGVIPQLVSKGIVALETIEFDFGLGGGLESVRTAQGSSNSTYALDTTYNSGVGPCWLDIWLDYYVENNGTNIIIAYNSFVNDINATANTYADITVKAPNSDTDIPLSLGATTQDRSDQWALNMQLVADKCTSRDLRMVIMGPSATADNAQSVQFGNASSLLNNLNLPVAYSLSESIQSLWDRYLTFKGFPQAADSISGRQIKWLRSELNL